MKIAVIGTGYVGLVTGTCFAESGHHVTCVDIDPRPRSRCCAAAASPSTSRGWRSWCSATSAEGRLRFTTSLRRGAARRRGGLHRRGHAARRDGEADLSYVLAAAESIGRALTGYCVVVNKSTVPVGSADQVRPRHRGRSPPSPSTWSPTPSSSRRGRPSTTSCTPTAWWSACPRERARAVMAELYAPFTRAEQPVLFMDPRSPS